MTRVYWGHLIVSVPPLVAKDSMPIPHLFPHLESLCLAHCTLTARDVTLSFTVNGCSACCPLCGCPSARVHSRYRRTLADLPHQWASRPPRRARAPLPLPCSRLPPRIFAERLPDLAAPFARRSELLQRALVQVGFALGGEAGARLADCLGMPTSPDTLLRLIRAAPLPAGDPPSVIGVDDWAYKRGLRYGSLICDLDRHRVVDLLPDRSADSIAMLKLVKRAMDGRGKFDLLRQRVRCVA